MEEELDGVRAEEISDIVLLMPLLIAEPTLLISEESVWLEELLCA